MVSRGDNIPHNEIPLSLCPMYNSLLFKFTTGLREPMNELRRTCSTAVSNKQIYFTDPVCEREGQRAADT
jgi:hypothetical protein